MEDTSHPHTWISPAWPLSPGQSGVLQSVLLHLPIWLLLVKAVLCGVLYVPLVLWYHGDMCTLPVLVRPVVGVPSRRVSVPALGTPVILVRPVILRVLVGTRVMILVRRLVWHLTAVVVGVRRVVLVVRTPCGRLSGNIRIKPGWCSGVVHISGVEVWRGSVWQRWWSLRLVTVVSVAVV